ncbi:MAG TPA: hypothetical protein VL131_10445 [Gammaproteobacteria bacterium]|nr:hypothetical protein [Gammaproteobacteria bacterium]
MSIWTELRDGIRQAILMQERLARLTTDVEKISDRLLTHDQRLTRIETMIEMARARLPG